MISSSAQLRMISSSEGDLELGETDNQGLSDFRRQTVLEKEAADIASKSKEEQEAIFDELRAKSKKELKYQSHYRALRALVKSFSK